MGWGGVGWRCLINNSRCGIRISHHHIRAYFIDRFKSYLERYMIDQLQLDTYTTYNTLSIKPKFRSEAAQSRVTENLPSLSLSPLLKLLPPRKGKSPPVHPSIHPQQILNTAYSFRSYEKSLTGETKSIFSTVLSSTYCIILPYSFPYLFFSLPPLLPSPLCFSSPRNPQPTKNPHKNPAKSPKVPPTQTVILPPSY